MASNPKGGTSAMSSWGSVCQGSRDVASRSTCPVPATLLLSKLPPRQDRTSTQQPPFLSHSDADHHLNSTCQTQRPHLTLLVRLRPPSLRPSQGLCRAVDSTALPSTGVGLQPSEGRFSGVQWRATAGVEDAAAAAHHESRLLAKPGWAGSLR